MTEAEEIQTRFRLICRECGSENVVIDFEQGIDYGGETGYSPGHLTIGCNDCHRNDIYISL